MTPQQTVDRSYHLLTYAYGLALLVLGADKVFRTYLIVNWEQYVGDVAQSVIPLTPATFVMVLGIAEILVGILMITKLTKVAAYITIATLVAIIINLLTMGLYDIAARDVLIALGALVLAWLSDATTQRRS